MTQDEITLKIVSANSYQELIDILNSLESPVVSLSRGEDKPKIWGVDKIIRNVGHIRQGGSINLITRTHGLRSKIAEFILSNNYGDGWELKNYNKGDEQDV